MFSVITNICNKKTKGSTLMELFTATGKLKKFFLTTRDVWCVHHGWQGTHRYDIQVLATHASTWVHRYSSLLQWSVPLGHQVYVGGSFAYFARNARCTVTTDFFFLWRCDSTRVMASSFLMFLDHTQRRTTVGRTPLDEWWARRRDLYLTTHDTHNRQISMPPVGFEPTISAGERPQTYALDRAATGTGNHRLTRMILQHTKRLPPQSGHFLTT